MGIVFCLLTQRTLFVNKLKTNAPGAAFSGAHVVFNKFLEARACVLRSLAQKIVSSEKFSEVLRSYSPLLEPVWGCSRKRTADSKQALIQVSSLKLVPAASKKALAAFLQQDPM